MTRVNHYESDFVIVGTGAGGATAARVLSEAGWQLTLLEEGPSLRTEDRPRALLDAMAASVRDMGTQTTWGAAPIPILQGRIVGGSTAINSGIIWRTPEDVREDWIARFGLGELVIGLDEVFARIEDELHIEPTAPALLGGNSERLAQGAAALGLAGKPITRNAAQCQGSARCLQGCPSAARQSMDVSYIPRSVAAGANLRPLHRAERILIERGRAVGIFGSVLDAETRRPVARFRARARRGVILAAGVVHTPTLLLRAGLRGPVGDGFQAHPGAAVMGRFDDVVSMGFGATQGYEVPLRDRGYKLESLAMPPEMMAARLPGAGAAWEERLRNLDHFAQWAAQVRMEARGTVRLGWGGAPQVRYEPTPRDVSRIHEAVTLLCEIMFAAGAREVYPGVAGLPEILRTKAEVDVVRHARVRRADFHLLASHLFGTARAGADPRSSVVAPNLESHDIRHLYVMDASALPTNMGVNPQHTIMAVVWQGAARLANAARIAA